MLPPAQSAPLLHCLAAGFALAAVAGVQAQTQVRPGSLLGRAFTAAERPGTVSAAFPGADGSVDITGSFSRVNGRPAPGIARLKQDGTPDAAFNSGAAPASSGAGGELLFFNFQTLVRPARLQRFDDGRLLVSVRPVSPDAPSRAVLDTTGRVLPGALPAVPPGADLLPQFERNGTLTAIVLPPAPGLPQVRRLLLSSGQDDPAFQLSRYETPPLQLIPAAEGGTWLLEQTTPGSFTGNPGTFRLTLLKPDGTPAPQRPRSFDATSAFLQAGPDGTFAVTTATVLPYWPMVSTAHGIDFRTANDSSGPPGSPLSLPGSPPLLAEPGGSVVMLEPGSGWLPGDPEPSRRTLWRRLPDGTADPSFRPPAARQTLHRLPDGRLLADGQHRYLANGTADAAWSVPDLTEPPAFSQIQAGPGGTVYTAGDFTRIGGRASPGLARWRAGGELDTTFTPAPAAGSVLDFAVLSDGRIMVLRSVPDAPEPRSVLQCLLPDGTADAAFVLSDTAGTVLYPLDRMQQIEPLPGGAILATVVWLAGDIRERLIVRIDAGGACTALPAPKQPATGDLFALGDGRFFAGGQRFLPDGTVDPSFLPPSGLTGVPLCAAGRGAWLFPQSGISGGTVLLRDDGSVDRPFTLIDSPAGLRAAAAGPGRLFYTAGGGGESGDRAVTRHFPDGRRDPSFRAPALVRRNEGITTPGTTVLGAAQDGAPATVSALLIHPETGHL